MKWMVSTFEYVESTRHILSAFAWTKSNIIIYHIQLSMLNSATLINLSEFQLNYFFHKQMKFFSPRSRQKITRRANCVLLLSKVWPKNTFTFSVALVWIFFFSFGYWYFHSCFYSPSTPNYNRTHSNPWKHIIL